MNGVQKRIALALGIAVLLIAAGSGILLAAGHTGQQSRGHMSASVATATSGGAGTATGSGTTATATTQHPTASTPQGSGGNVGLAPTDAPGSGRIISATLAVDHSSYNGVCSNSGEPFVFTLTVTVTPHVTSLVEINYEWQGNATSTNGLSNPTLLLAGEETTKSLTFAVNSFGSAPNGADSWLAIQIWHPVTLMTNRAHFSVNCLASLASVDGSASPAIWDGVCGNYQDITLMFTAYLAPMSASVQSLPWTMTTDVPNSPETGGSVWHPYQTSGNAPVLFSGDGTKVVGWASFYLYVHLTNQDANGSYWVTVTVNGPNNSSMSKTVTITKNCN
jgi:hypothetical protein